MINLMTNRCTIATLAALFSLGLTSVFSATSTMALMQEIEPILAPVPPAEDEDYDVLTRGPLHEAFANVHQANPEPSPLLTKQPPATFEEVPPEYKPEGNNVQWIPGYWAWDVAQDDFIWISGVWRDVPPGRRWVPGYWEETAEGFRWVSGFWAEEESQELGYLPEPPASIDQGPSVQSPGDNFFYVPGNWDYYNNDYRWLSGHWQPIVGTWIWVPARYVWTPRGCIFVSGFWDYEVEYRGTCFAPVYFHRPVYVASYYRYTPRCVVNVNVDFLTHLFVRPGYGCYFYGDWYGSSFVSIGYKPWVNYHSHHRHYDPLWSYYRCQRSPYDRRYNVVQYIGQQHNFYADHHEYRPRPKFSAHLDFVAKSKKSPHHDHVRRASYVNNYDQHVQKTRITTNERKHDIGDHISDRLAANDLNKDLAKYRKVDAQDRLSTKQKTEAIANLQRQRQTAEIKRQVAKADATRNHPRPSVEKLRLPATDNPLAKNLPQRGVNDPGSTQKNRIDVTKSGEQAKILQRAVDKARREAAKIQQQPANQPRKTVSKDNLNTIGGGNDSRKQQVLEQQQARRLQQDSGPDPIEHRVQRPSFNKQTAAPQELIDKRPNVSKQDNIGNNRQAQARQQLNQNQQTRQAQEVQRQQDRTRQVQDNTRAKRNDQIRVAQNQALEKAAQQAVQTRQQQLQQQREQAKQLQWNRQQNDQLKQQQWSRQLQQEQVKRQDQASRQQQANQQRQEQARQQQQKKRDKSGSK